MNPLRSNRIDRPPKITNMKALLSLLMLLPLGCGQNAETAPFLVAHRGSSESAPENTLAAFNLAWSEGARFIEGDFCLTADGRVVCIHDKDTERTSGKLLSVAETTSNELRQLDVGSWKSDRWTGQRIPYLEEVLATVPDNGTLLLEIKCGSEILPALAKILGQSTLKPEQVDLICFNSEVLDAANKLLPKHAAWWLVSFKEKDGVWQPEPDEIFHTLEAIGAEGFGCNANLTVVQKSFADALHAKGYSLNVWTVNEAAVAAELRQRGADLITTDRPSQLTVELH